MEKKITFDNRSADCLCRENIFPDLLSGGHVIEFGPGQYGYGKTFLAVFKYFERACYRLALEQKPEEYVYPVMIPMAYLERCDFFGDRPRSGVFLSRLRQEADGSSGFAKSRGGQKPPFFERLLPPGHVCKSAVCLHCYPQFQDARIPEDRPVVITTQGRCYRYEGERIKTLETLWEFIMREVVYLGGDSFVRKKLAEIRGLTAGWMARLGIRCWVETADDLFFAESEPVRERSRSIEDAKQELRVSLPYAADSLAAASFNFHGTHFSRSFNITDGKDYVSTGCAGFGIERLTYAFLSQYGLRTDLWPRPVRDEVLAKP